ncbi:MAG TPA: Ig-like domain-containing protein [Mycobacterium sp.]|nr:Ig-like domain-containing protein [Mycobacterium sp.]
MARKSGEPEEESTLLASPRLTSQSVGDEQAFAFAAMAATNSAPTASPTVNAPNDADGTVTGALNATDPEGPPMSYAVTGTPAKGTVTLNPAGAFSYTPTQAARLAASQTAGADTDSFTVRVSDGETTQDVTVTVPLSSTQLQTNTALPSGTSTLGNSPSAAVVGSDGRMYVANTDSNSVSVINTVTGQRIDANTSPSSMDIAVGSSPSALALSSDGKKLFVANTGSNTVSVINTDNYTMIDTSTASGVNSIAVGSAPSALALGSDGRLYVANRSSNTVTVINTNTSNYAAIDTSTATGVNPIAVGSAPSALAVGPNGRLYVVNATSGTVSVIDTANYARIDADPTSSSMDIRVGASPSSVALSPDGSLAYVTNGLDTVSVIDTKSNTVARTVTIDSPVESGGHVIVLSADGNRIYISDAFDKKVRSLSLVHVNTAPQPNGQPLVISTDPNTGAVLGSPNVSDIDGDKMTYSTATGTGPASGAVTYDATSGTYTYTPTQAAREAAWGTSTEDYDHFSVTVNDGQGGTITVPVTVTISAMAPPPAQEIPHQTTAVTVGNYPSSVAIANNKAYVVNSYDFTVSVYDATTNAQVGEPIPVGYLPTRVIASSTGDRVYVSNYDSVTVIDTSTDDVIGTVYVPVQDGEYYNGVWDMAVDGNRLYAARGDGTVSVIDVTNPANPAVISTTPVNFWDGDMELTPDKSRLYAATTGSAVSVVDAHTMATIDTIYAGPEWDLNAMQSEKGGPTYNVATKADGTRLYVTHEVQVVERAVGGYSSGFFISDSHGRLWRVTDTYSAVTVIDTDPSSATYNKEIAMITVADGATDVAVSGNRVYVTHSDGRIVTVIDTATNRVIGTFTTDQNSSVGYRTITVGPDGSFWITDSGDNKVYVTSFPSPA